MGMLICVENTRAVCYLCARVLVCNQFYGKGEKGIVDAVPMARMKDGAFLMKVGNSYRKFKMDDIVEESFKAKTVFKK